MSIKMSPVTRWAVAAVAVSTVLVTGCGRKQAGPQRGPAEVGVVTLQAERVVLTTELPGRTRPTSSPRSGRR